MEELEEKAFKEIHAKLVQVGIIKSEFRGSITVHIVNNQILDYETLQRKSFKKKK